MLKCCGCQTNFILSLGGSFLFSKNFLSTPSLTGGLVRPIRRTNKQEPTSIKLEAGSFIYNAKKRYPNFLEYRSYFIL